MASREPRLIGIVSTATAVPETENQRTDQRAKHAAYDSSARSGEKNHRTGWRPGINDLTIPLVITHMAAHLVLLLLTRWWMRR